MQCSACGSSLVANVEIETLSCVDCIRTFPDRIKKLTEDLMSERSLRELSDKKIANLKELMKIESEGQTAAWRGIEQNQCPYEDSDKRSMWETGWSVGALFKRSEASTAVVRWAIFAVEHALELAEGYGQREIADKLESVVRKLEEIVE